MRGHAHVSALIRMDIVQLREHHLRRARAHPLILSTFSPAEAMPPSGINTNAKMGSFSSIFLSTNTEVGDARFLEERTGTRPASGTWVLGPTLGLLVSWVRGSWGSHLMGLTRAPDRLVLRLARLDGLTHLVRVPE